MAEIVNTISISAVIDAVGALATDSLSGQIYLMDTNKANGSTGQGTENLRTVVAKGDKLVWTVIPLECEAYVAIDEIVIDQECCEVKVETFPDTDITYWVGTVIKDVTVTPYSIKYKVGSRAEPIATPSPIYLVGKGL